MLRVGKYNWKTKIQSNTPSYTKVLIHVKHPLSPYVLTDGEGCIFENVWQFSKIYKTVPEQKQVQWYGSWCHPHEVHLDGEGIPTEEYWEWREKGMRNKTAVRYPVGFYERRKCLGTYFEESDGAYSLLGYIEARKKIYVQLYKDYVQNHPVFLNLKKLLEEGTNLQINEVDGPTYHHEYPYNKVVKGSIEINKDTIEALLNNPKQPFGHGYTIAGLLGGFL